MTRASLPIDTLLPQIIESLRCAGAVVLRAEPGAGKTTRVPPAILEAGLTQISKNESAQLVVLQPRRVAARAAASRVAYERGTPIGSEIGYQVRHENRSTRHTKILFCTEGILLRRLQDDPFIEAVAAVVFDEFHERNIDSDLALAMVKQIRETVRPELKVVVMSATMDMRPVSDFLGGCPMLESAGRTFPVAIEYLSAQRSGSIEELAADGVKRKLPQSSGDLLVFLPGIGEIRETQTLLEPLARDAGASLLSLYGDLPLEQQQQVLLPATRKKIILATNVAETSLTIEGVTTVIDCGFARVNRLDQGLGLNRLDLTRISRASADQRAGRAGRTGPGECLRLWSEREHHLLPDFELPEIKRVDLSQSILQLAAWGEHDVYAFPWFEPPLKISLDQALKLLERLGAMASGQLTPLGREMARLPLQPRLARLLAEGAALGQVSRAALCAALLAERSPFRRPPRRIESAHVSDSDLVDRMMAMENFAAGGERDSYAGELLPAAARQVLRARNQLTRVAEAIDLAWARDIRRNPDENTSSGPESLGWQMAILKSLVFAFPDRICHRRSTAGRRALMVGGRGVRLADESAVMDSDLFVAVEVVDSGQTESLVRIASSVDRNWLPQEHLSTNVEVFYDHDRQRVIAVRKTRFCDLVIEESSVPLPTDVDAGTILAEAIAAKFDIGVLVDEDSARYLARIRCLKEWLPEVELPELGDNPWHELLAEWCAGCTSVAELRSRSLVWALKSRLTHQQLEALEQEAPDCVSLPGGRRAKLEYEVGKPPVLAARIQELFGLLDTPRIARAKVPLLLHLLAPNYRIQQITPDLRSFWQNTYPEVRKDLKGRYPKHAWPEDPLSPQPAHNPRKRN